MIYVPSYSPTYVYGPPVYPYPPICYPPYTPGAAFVGFTMGVMIGAAWGGVALLYGAKAMENASVAKTNAAPTVTPDGSQPAQ